MVITYTNVEKKLVVVKDVEKMFGNLGKIPFEPFKEEQEEGINTNIALEKQVTILNESFIKKIKSYLFRIGALPQVANNFTI